MLSGDAARTALLAYETPVSERTRGVQLHRPDAPRLATDIVTNLTATVDTETVDHAKPWRSIAQQLDQVSLAEREAVLSAVSPHLGADLARWWDWCAEQPYQRGWQRRAYRSPDRADSLRSRWRELRQFLLHAVQYPQPLAWHAEWALHLGQYVPLGSLFASAIAHGDAAVAGVVTASLRGEHDISGPSHHAYVALLSSPDPTAWAEVERLLVAAQRSEGLRQTILETADLAHPDAFARILDVVVEHRLARFAGTVRALGVWLGEDLTVRQEKQVAEAVAAIRDHLRQPPRPEALADADPIVAFLGLWSLAVRDVRAATAGAELVLDSADERSRLAAARLLTDFAVPATAAGLTRAVADSSIAVYAAAVAAWPAYAHASGRSPVPMPEDVRSSLYHRVGDLGKVRDVDTGLLGTLPRKVSGTLAADVLICHSRHRPLDPALVAAASADGRSIAAREYAADPSANREALFSLLTDRSAMVRDIAGKALQSLPAITAHEARLAEDALARKSADLRTAALSLLQKQEPVAVAASVERLSAGSADQRRAADELRGRIEADTAAPDEIPAAIRFHVSDRTPAVRPTAAPARSWERHHDAFRLVWTSLAGWLAAHANVEVRTPWGVELLSNIRLFPAGNDLPVPEILGPWWERIGPQLTDGGVEVAILAHLQGVHLHRADQSWFDEVVRTVVGPVASEFSTATDTALEGQVLRRLATHAKRDSWAEPLLALLETAAAALPVDRLDGSIEVLERRGRRPERDRWGNVIRHDDRAPFRELFRGMSALIAPSVLTDEQVARLWRAARFVDEPEGAIDRWDGPQIEVSTGGPYGPPGGSLMEPDQPDRWPAPVRILAEAFTRGAATRADLIDALLVTPNYRAYQRARQNALPELTGLRPQSWAAAEGVQAVVADVRAAVIAVEADRGDLPTALSETAHGFRTTYGASELTRCLAALGKRPFARAYAWTQSRESSLSHLIRVNQPLPDDTAETLGRLVDHAKISDRRLIETAVYAPQWSRLIEEHLGWSGLESAVWWVHAHTKDDSWTVDAEIRAQWASEVSQRTPLDVTDLVNGAADVGWFRAVIDTLGERFGQVLKAAKYASSSGGHKRAELFATALLGKVDEADLTRRIREKRHQDSVRALGLLPLPDDRALLERYELLRAFVASDRTSGSQRRASESTAVEVGLENLARTAGFADPQRLVWAMEAEAVRDLTEGPVTAADGDLVVALAVDASGAPKLTVQRAGKRLKSVPPKSAKVPQIAELRDRAAALHKQIRRMRISLESACVLADAFDPQELSGLLDHPIVAPMLRELVLVDEEALVGFAVSGGRLAAPDGAERAASGALRVAHPVDLLASGEWPDFQRALMSGERRQPFKQLFRELYTLNENERDEAGMSSRRYAGHQVERRKAGGLFTARGWVADFEQGFSRTFHQQKITAWCHLVYGFGSPAEVEDAAIDDVTFRSAGEWKPLPLAEVPARVFSETMRDLDLVVSVAHSGGVDPEASESSMGMRGRLVAETATMLGMTNVEVGGHHARVAGALGTYSVHLGSGVVHRLPGNAVCIVPVSAQHRGRIFLPFADDDPRTAEIVAKIVLLARDDKIKDPTILQQLVR